MSSLRSPSARGALRADPLLAVRSTPLQSEDIVFWPVAFIHAPLPQSPPDEPVWVTTDGKLVSTLSSASAEDAEGRVRPVGLPYGMLARLIALFLVTYAVQKKTPVVPLCTSISAFARALGIASNGGSNGRLRYLYDQLLRLGSCTLTTRWSHQAPVAHAAASRSAKSTPSRPFRIDAGKNGALVEHFVLWCRGCMPTCTSAVPLRGTGEDGGGVFVLTPSFAAATQQASVPLDRRLIHALRPSPMAFDVYAWCSYTAARLQRKGHTQMVVAWSQLYKQFGCPTQRPQDFPQAFKRALERIRIAWPELSYQTPTGRLVFTTCRPHVPHKRTKW